MCDAECKAAVAGACMIVGGVTLSFLLLKRSQIHERARAASYSPDLSMRSRLDGTTTARSVHGPELRDEELMGAV
jgi:hypothetical protein